MRLLLRLAAALAVAAPALVVAGTPAEAAVYTATGVRCTIVGTAGPDHLHGTAHRDVICGRGGADVISGRGGDDVLTGGGGDDVVSGGPGDDDLTGGPGGDSIYGGDGTNWCTLDPEDPIHRHCVYDKSRPQSEEIRLVDDTVDVTSASADVTVRIHVADDTGVEFVQAVNRARLVSGDVRDGWWESTFTVPRWSPPGPWGIDVWLRDRTNREAYAHTDALTVVDRDPDTEFPSLTAASIAPTSVDVRTASATLTIDATISDPKSGVSTAYACLDKPSDAWDGFDRSSCTLMDRVSGDIHDGSWTGRITVPKGSATGDWAVFLAIADRARPDEAAEWAGPDEYPHWTCDETCHTDRVFRLPDGIGRVQVTGVDDPSPPSLVTATVTPAEIDSLPSDSTVSVDIHATDVDADGIDSVAAAITSATADGSEPSWFTAPITQPASGTRHDGVWHFEFTIAQGTAPGTYYLTLSLVDSSHTRSFAAPGSPYEGQPGTVTLTPEQGAGTLTIVQHTY